MRVVVTGANGHLGRVVVSLLLEQGIELVGRDKEVGGEAGACMGRVDLCDLGQVFGAMAGADGVIRLGAIPSPRGRPPELVYFNNVMSQFNVFEAAAGLPISRVVSASSISAFGFPFQHRWSEPLYLPLDEAHPLLPQDAYGLSKATGEEIAAACCRRHGAHSPSRRISTIVDDSTVHQLLERVLQNPQDCASSLSPSVLLNDFPLPCLLALPSPFD